MTRDQTSAKTIASTADRKVRVLAVDDEDDILLIIKKYLELQNYEVTIYNNPLKALQDYRPNLYDLVILDIRMPGMDGFELYKKIRELDARVKVCFLTAFETYRDRFRELFPELEEVKCYIKKPVSAAQLARHVQTALELK